MIPSRNIVARRATSLSYPALRSSTLASRTRRCQAWQASSPRTTLRAFSTTGYLGQNAFPSQLENTPNSADLLASLSASAPATTTPQTMTEKIVQKYAVGLPPGKKVKSGDYITFSPEIMMSHDNTAPIIKKWQSLGASKVHNPDQLVVAFDHAVQDVSETNLKKIQTIKEFAEKHSIKARYPPGAGIGHQLMVENGFAYPGTMCVASDSHSNHYGGVSCLGTAVVRTDGAAIYATGQTWWKIPPSVKVTLTGIMPPGVTGKDVIMALSGLFNQDEVLNHAVEIVGSEQTLNSIPIDYRLSISNQSTEWGAASCIWPIDSVLEGWLRGKATTHAMDNPEMADKGRLSHKRIDELYEDPPAADPGVTYDKSLYLNLSTLSPFITGPNSVKVATPLKDLETKDIAINKAYLVSCTNSRSSDIASAAAVVREATKDGVVPKLAKGVELYMAAASKAEQQIAEDAGDWQLLIEAGAHVLPSGCGPCIGMGAGLLEAGENGISASNRPFRGRMGHKDANTYLASPAVVLASALKGKIAGPGWYQKPEGVEKVIIGEGTGDYQADKAVSIEDALDKIIAEAESMISAAEKTGDGEAAKADATAAEEGQESLTEILPGFPEQIEGEIVFLDADNISTDGIYPGKYTYQDNISREEMKGICMENYDTAFGEVARPGDILVSGNNFGTGSSREQAATAILSREIPLVIAGSFNSIFARNGINNALLTIEVPKLVERLREEFGKAEPKQLTRRTGWKVKWDAKRSKVTVTQKDGETWSEKVGEMPPNVQDIIAKGGLEGWVKAEIQKSQ